MKSFLKFLSYNKTYTVIVIVGISVALAFLIPFVGVFSCLIETEHSCPDYERTYTICPFYSPMACFGEADFIKANFPEVESAIVFSTRRPGDVKIGRESYGVTMLFCTPDIFEYFPTVFYSGSPEVLENFGNVLVSHSFSRRIGLGDKALGETLLLDNRPYTICGIVEDYNKSVMPYNDIILNIGGPTLQFYRDHPDRFHQMNHCFFKLRKGNEARAVERKMKKAFVEHYGNAFRVRIDTTLELLRYDEIVRSGKYGYLTGIPTNTFAMLCILCVSLLLFAVFNYVNLNVALGLKRARDMATRRLLGSSRVRIILKQLSETAVLTLLCFVLALVLSTRITPILNKYAIEQGIPAFFGFNLSPENIGMCLASLTIITLAAGLIPAFVVSRYKAIDVVNGTFRFKGKRFFSKILVFIQMFISVILIMICIGTVRQYRFLLNKDIGVDMDNVYWLYGPYAHHELDPCIDSLRALPCVEKVGYCLDRPGAVEMFGDVQNPADSLQLRIAYRILYCSQEAFEVFNFKILKDFGRRADGCLWLSESMVRDFDLDEDNPQIDGLLHDTQVIGPVAGIIGDFVGDKVYDDYPIMVKILDDWYLNSTAYYKSLAIKTCPDVKDSEKQILDCIRKTLDQTSGVYKAPYEKGFMRDLCKEQISGMRSTTSMLILFMVMMTLLSLLGLFGISLYSISIKDKDIAIRKVFGASFSEEMWRNLKGYVLLSLAAAVAGLVTARAFLNTYFIHYTYKSIIGWTVYALSGLMTIIIATVTVFATSVSSLRSNPSEKLKKE